MFVDPRAPQLKRTYPKGRTGVLSYGLTSGMKVGRFSVFGTNGEQSPLERTTSPL